MQSIIVGAFKNYESAIREGKILCAYRSWGAVMGDLDILIIGFILQMRKLEASRNQTIFVTFLP